MTNNNNNCLDIYLGQKNPMGGSIKKNGFYPALVEKLKGNICIIKGNNEVV
jgi:hypothetical protein